MKALSIIILAALTLTFIKYLTNLLEAFGRKKSVSTYRVKYISKTFNLAIVILFFLIATLIIGIDSTKVLVFASSVFAVIGIALFAQWSILSNITGGLIIFFAFPYRVGDKIKVLDKDEDISGVIEEITLFNVLIKKDDNLITYPNNLIMQKGVIKYCKPSRRNKQSVLASEIEKTDI